VFDDAVDIDLRDAELSTKGQLRYTPVGIPTPYLTDLMSGQFDVRCTLAGRRPASDPALGGAVAHVVTVRTSEPVRPVLASWVVTGMADLDVRRERAERFPAGVETRTVLVAPPMRP
jgi:hypothetical protein